MTGPFRGKNSLYRFHVEDPLRFDKSIRVTIEHGHNNKLSNDYSSTAYWYQFEPHGRFPKLLSPKQRLARPDWPEFEAAPGYAERTAGVGDTQRAQTSTADEASNRRRLNARVRKRVSARGCLAARWKNPLAGHAIIEMSRRMRDGVGTARWRAAGRVVGSDGGGGAGARGTPSTTS